MGALIWLASYPKSGNTWMRIFLLNLLRDRDEPLDINKMAALSPLDTGRSWYEPFSKCPLEELSEPKLAKLIPLGHRRITELRPDPILVKTHNFFGNWHGVPLHTPSLSAGAIYIVRNPLDVVTSLRSHFGMADLDRAITYMANDKVGSKLGESRIPEFFRSWSIRVESWTAKPKPNSRIYTVRYEDLVSDTQAQFTRIARVLGIPANEKQIARALRFSSFDSLKKQEAEKGFIERPENSVRFFREGKTEAWREVLSREQVERIISDHRTQMARFNYIPDGY